MRAITLRVFVTLLALTLLATAADAQRRGPAQVRPRPAPALSGLRVGGHLGYNFDDAIAAVLLGAQLSYPITPDVDLYPSFDYYFVDPGSLWSLNGDIKYRPPTRYGFWYVGGGLNISHASVFGLGDTKVNLNLLTGLERRRRAVAPYVEARFILGDNSSFQLAGGVSFFTH